MEPTKKNVVVATYDQKLWKQRYYDLLVNLKVAVALLRLSSGIDIRIRRETILLISLTLTGFLVPPHICRGAILPMSDLLLIPLVTAKTLL